MIYPKVLIISHNALSNNDNMGKTLASFIRQFPKDNVAQLFLHEGNPNSDLCSNYYKFTDKDALKSVFLRWNNGKRLTEIENPDTAPQLHKGAIYRLGRKKKPLVSFFRDAVWRLSNSFNRKLKKWLKEFDPDVIFFACSDSKFSYRLTRKIVLYLKKPLALCCFDDYYLNCNYSTCAFGKAYFRGFLKEVFKTFDLAKLTFAVNEKMSEAYRNFFDREFPVLYTSAECQLSDSMFDDRHGICYLGGLGYGRDKQLVALGKALREGKYPNLPKHIDVYSPENNDAVLRELTKENGIVFHGSVSHNEVSRVIKSSKALIHTESFEKKIIERTKFSLSTKIPESLGSGALLIAYGPKEVASIDYLLKNDAAVVSDDVQSLLTEVSSVFSDKRKYQGCIEKQKQLYLRNHTVSAVSKVFIEQINKIVHLQS